jgi:hypothetical protein
MQCVDVAPFIVRRADAPETLDAATRAAVDSHVAGCAACRAVLDEQRAVAGMLRMRPVDAVSARFAAQLAARINGASGGKAASGWDAASDSDAASGWFGIVDWKRWTLRLTPVAAALALATYLGLGASSQAPVSVDEWALGTTDAQAESMPWDSGVSADSVLETMLTGESANTRETGNVR